MTYATVQNIRDEGVTVPQLSDVRAAALLTRASRYIDDVSGQWFEPRTRTLALDGTDAELLHLDVPAIALTSVTVDDLALELGDVIVYGAPGSLDRRNPKLARKHRRCWPDGRQNVVLVGSFGFVEEDGTSPPPEIVDVCLRLVVRYMPLLTDTAAQTSIGGDIRKETTDGHSYERFERAQGAAGSWRWSGLTGDPSIDITLQRFRRPIAGGLAR